MGNVNLYIVGSYDKLLVMFLISVTLNKMDKCNVNHMLKSGFDPDSLPLFLSLTHTFSQVFGHADFNHPLFSESYREVHGIFRQTLQGPPLQQLAETMLCNLQTVLERGLPCEHDWLEEGLQSFTNRIMFEAGFLTLFGKDAGFLQSGGVSGSRICMQKAEQDFLVFDRAFPLLAAGLPISLIAQAWRAREALAEELLHDELHQRKCISDLILRRMDAFDRMHLDETGKARTHVCMLWASQANTLPAAFWSLYYTLRSFTTCVMQALIKSL